MRVADGMTSMVVCVGPAHTLRQAAKLMRDHSVGAAVVMDAELPGPSIITERDLLNSLGDGQDPDTELVSEHAAANLVFAEPDWSLDQAASEMVKAGFRHLVVIDRGEVQGVLSMRDIVRCWTEQGVASGPQA